MVVGVENSLKNPNDQLVLVLKDCVNSLKVLNGLLDMVLKDFGENNLKALNGLVVAVVVDTRKHRMEGMAPEDRDEEDSMDLKVDTHNLEEEEEDGEGMDMDCYKGMESHDHYPFFQQSKIKRKNCVIL